MTTKVVRHRSPSDDNGQERPEWQILWSRLAQKRLREIREYVATDKPEAAERLAMRIVASTDLLRHFPYLGRAGPEPGVRELVISGTPYIALYRVRGNLILVSTIWHGAQRRTKTKRKR